MSYLNGQIPANEVFITFIVLTVIRPFKQHNYTMINLYNKLYSSVITDNKI